MVENLMVTACLLLTCCAEPSDVPLETCANDTAEFHSSLHSFSSLRGGKLNSSKAGSVEFALGSTGIASTASGWLELTGPLECFGDHKVSVRWTARVTGGEANHGEVVLPKICRLIVGKSCFHGFTVSMYNNGFKPSGFSEITYQIRAGDVYSRLNEDTGVIYTGISYTHELTLPETVVVRLVEPAARNWRWAD